MSAEPLPQHAPMIPSCRNVRTALTRCKPNRRVLPLAAGVCLVVCSDLVLADPPAVDPQYGLPLEDPVPLQSPSEAFAARVVGEESGVVATLRVCGESFPAFDTTNKLAYEKWRNVHQRSLADVERSYAAVVLRYFHGDSSKASKVREESLQNVVAAARRAYHAMDPKMFEGMCRVFPQILNLPGMDIDAKYKSEFADLREHPVDTPGGQEQALGHSTSEAKKP